MRFEERWLALRLSAPPNALGRIRSSPLLDADRGGEDAMHEPAHVIHVGRRVLLLLRQQERLDASGGDGRRRQASEIAALEMRGVDRLELVVRDEARRLTVEPPEQHLVEARPAIGRERLESLSLSVRLQLELTLHRAGLGLGPGGARHALPPARAVLDAQVPALAIFPEERLSHVRRVRTPRWRSGGIEAGLRCGC